MSLIATQITSLTIVCSTVYLGADQRKYQSSTSLAFVLGIHRWPVNSPHKGPVTRKMFPFDDVIMWRHNFMLLLLGIGGICAPWELFVFNFFQKSFPKSKLPIFPWICFCNQYEGDMVSCYILPFYSVCSFHCIHYMMVHRPLELNALPITYIPSNFDIHRGA